MAHFQLKKSRSNFNRDWYDKCFALSEQFTLKRASPTVPRDIRSYRRTRDIYEKIPVTVVIVGGLVFVIYAVSAIV